MGRMLLLLGVSFAGVAVGAVGATYVRAQGTPQITRTEILRKSMSGLEGKEVVVFLADPTTVCYHALQRHLERKNCFDGRRGRR